MYKYKKILALIPARGGSKGLPGKNIRLLAGKPLIAWSIEQAKGSKYLDKVVVSTDYENIAKIAEQFGAEVPFIRPAELAADDSSSIDVIFHAIDFLKNTGQQFDYIALLEPTSPLRESADIDNAIENLIDKNEAKAIVGVSKLESAHPEFNVLINNENGFIKKYLDNSSIRVLRRQELPDVYFFEGTIYISDIDFLAQKRTFYHELTLPYVVPRWKSMEIDEICDLIMAEALLNAKAGGIF